MVPDQSQQSNNKGFFAVDVRCFRKACANINTATAYLVMACGTGGNNGTTAWSVNAIEKYTSISRSRSKLAIEQLIGGGLVLRVKSGLYPRYRLLSWQDLGEASLPSLTLSSVLARIKANEALSKHEIKSARALVSRGLAIEEPFGQFKPAENKAQLSWLPNAFVCGADGEAPPLERLRRLGDSMLLQLAVDLYEHHLADDGGIAKGIICGQYDRQLKASMGAYRIFEFSFKSLATYSRGPVAAHMILNQNGERDLSPFWDRISKLTDAGILEWVPTLFEGPGEISEPMFQLGNAGSGSIEDQLGSAAHTAAACLLARHYNLVDVPQSLKGAPSEHCQLVPVRHSFEQATMLKIARLRYRPHTKRTAEWFERLAVLNAQHLETYTEIIASMAPAVRQKKSAA
jgi:hypothetical protein